MATSIFPFPHNVFCSITKLNLFCITVLDLKRSKILCLEKGYNSKPNNKILELSKLEAFADHKINANQKIEICFGKSRKCFENKEKILVNPFLHIYSF